MDNGLKTINPQLLSVSNRDDQLMEVFTDEVNPGLTKKEYFSSLFIQGILSSQTQMRANGIQNDHFSGQVENIFSEAIVFADELLKQLEKTQK
ncbi:hypothetical protein [Epilithonimonas caeni]|uniref:hypothetical protein n=1 Tax=Epilithonimonas caeni TaxID=365343 RepID=UPI000424BF85|nr:hypothetical protein [Epilithonimonas caeni]